MTYSERNAAINMMANYDSNGAFMAQMCINRFWSSEDIDELLDLWDVVHKPVKELFAPYGIKEISDRFCIPYRTVQNWYDGNRECAKWVRLLIHKALSKDLRE